MGAIDDYLRKNASSLADNLGDTTAELRENPSDAQAWTKFALGASKQMWSALPGELRGDAIEGLNKGIATASEVATIGLDLAATILDAASVSTETIPIIGQAVGYVLVVADQIIVAVGSTKSMHRTVSTVEQNWEQTRSLTDVKNPNDWAAGIYPLHNFEYYQTDPDKRRDGVAWRLIPCLTPSFRDPAVWGLGFAPRAEGNCDPGRKLELKSGYKFETDDDTQTCKAFGGISALFWPFWSPNHLAEPIAIYTTAENRNPNSILIARQHALLAHPPTNMRVRGARLNRARVAFTQYFRDKADALGGLIEVEDGRIPNLGRNPIGIDSSRYAIDPERVESHAYAYGADVPKLFWNANGMIEAYTKNDPDLGDVGVPSFGPPSWATGLAYTAAQLNAVVGGVKAFFVARAAMLEQPYAMAALASGGIGTLRRYDPAIRAAIKESAKGAA